MTDEEMIAEIQSNSLLNRVRQIFAGESARLEQAGQQRFGSPTPVEWRKMEFDAAQRILDVTATRDLLEALETVFPDDYNAHPQDYAEEWHKARAAIAKARQS